MEIKHTVEILTKDIQDIEKLVRNLNNYPSPPRIDLDLALSKLRNAYDLLLLIAEDSKKSDPEIIQLNPNISDTAPPHKQNEPKQEILTNTESKQIPEPTHEPTYQKVTETEPIPETEPLTEPDVVHQQEIINQTKTETTPAPPTENKTQTKTEHSILIETAIKDDKNNTILADKFKSDASINERIAGSEQPDLATKISGEAIESIKRNIGINDRFLIIRELLNGDNESFNVFIQELDHCTNFNQASQLLESRFHGHMKHEGVQVLINLAKRKFIE